MKETAGIEPAAPITVDAVSDAERAIALWQRGLSAVKIGRELDISDKVVRAWLREARIDTSRPATWAGLISLSEAESKFGIDRHTLAAAAKTGRVRARGTSNFYGPTTYLFHPLELGQDLGRLQCRHEGCDAIALGESGACEHHGHIYLGARAAGVKRPDIGPKIAAAKRGTPRPDARKRLAAAWRTGGTFARGTLELPWVTGLARQRWLGRWAGNRGGRPREYSEDQAREVLELRAKNQKLGERTIAERVGVTRRQVRAIFAAHASS